MVALMCNSLQRLLCLNICSPDCGALLKRVEHLGSGTLLEKIKSVPADLEA